MGELLSFERIHMVGVGGAGMSALAKLLTQAGHEVSGSDLRPGGVLEGLANLGVEVWTGHQPSRARQSDLVVASSAVPEGDPEMTAARAAGLTVWRRPDLLGALTQAMPALGVTGTHGKTTTSAMLVAALRAGGRDPSFVVGGDLLDLGTNAHLGERDLFVLEADEAFGTFERLFLEGLIVTNIEADHLDHYHDYAGLHGAFVAVARAVAGPVVACLDDPGAAELAAATGAITYGTAPVADWRLQDLDETPAAVRFRLEGPADHLSVAVPRPGRHIALDAAGALALIGTVGIDPAQAARGLASFGGVHRRFEQRASVGGIEIIDDYAHHPTEVAATVAAGRARAPGRLWAVFQPHRYSRTAELAAEFGPALAAADRVVVTDVYAAGENPVPGVNGKLVADAVVGPPVTYLAHRADLAPYLAQWVEPGDLVLTIGAGDITLVGDELVSALGGGR